LQPSGKTGGQNDTLRLSCHDVNWREHAESKASKMPCPHTFSFSRYFLT